MKKRKVKWKMKTNKKKKRNVEPIDETKDNSILLKNI